VTEQTTELNFPSRVESIAEATEVAVELARRAGFSDESLYGIDMAVREAFTNAVLHGSGGDESKLAGLEVQVLGDALHIAVRDRGEGFDPATIPDPTDPQNLLKASGRGILFMRTFMDDVTWEPHPDGGTVVRMTKKR
jgi:serine/threonine-protein kinase RsbW